ncbi:MAG: hypothetical protein ABIY50_12410 [Ignavibacteria bacterium]
MKTIKIILVLFITTVLLNDTNSQTNTNFRKLELSNKILNQEFNPSLTNKLNLNNLTKAGEKSPYLGALFSGIIPGAGEVYGKNYLKAGIFFVIEAGLWTAYSIFQNKGDDQTKVYQNYADQNWDVYKYARWLKEQNFAGAENINLLADKDLLRRQLNVVEAQNFSHQLPPYGEQQYYELIGKYQNFVTGWADADLNIVNRANYGNYKTTMFKDYSFERQEANKFYDKGTTTLTVVLLNHILSAADAAWTVSMFNKSLKVKTGIHMENKYSHFGDRKLVPVANMNITF